eukprot:14665518-Alexandrium_andersonii.AAC.1
MRGVCVPTLARGFRLRSSGIRWGVRQKEQGAPSPERRLDIEGRCRRWRRRAFECVCCSGGVADACFVFFVRTARAWIVAW